MSIKHSLHTLLLMVTLCTILSCKEKVPIKINEDTKITFSFSTTNTKPSFTQKDTNDISRIVVSIKNNEGQFLFNKRELNVFRLGDDKFISDPITLKTGSYTLTEFFVIDDSNKILLIVPTIGSRLDDLTSNTVPLELSVGESSTSKVELEVLTTYDISPSDVGYNGFYFKKKDDFRIYIASIIKDKNLTKGYSFAEAKINISGDGQILHNGVLEKEFNSITLDTTNSNGLTISSYTITINKTNFLPYSKTFAHEKIKSFSSNPLSAALAPDLAIGLQAYYSFNGTINDESGNGRHSRLVQIFALTPDRKGNINQAFRFNESSRITSAHDNFGVSGTFSISFWGTTRSASKTQFYVSKFGNKGFKIFSSELQSWTFETNDGSRNIDRVSSSGFKIENDIWYHIVVVADRNIRKLYVNSVLMNTVVTKSTEENDLFSNNSALIMGYSTIDGTGIPDPLTGLEGALDEVRIYNRTLSNAEIAALFNE